jgi:hypothetical protein
MIVGFNGLVGRTCYLKINDSFTVKSKPYPGLECLMTLINLYARGQHVARGDTWNNKTSLTFSLAKA